MVDLTVTQLAERLGVTTRRARDLLRSEEITGRQLANGTWLADSDAIARYEISASRGSGRTLDAATAWGLLWELSGLDADWLSASTRARVRRRIRDSVAEALAAAVSKRTRAHRFTAANAERASAGLIRTGRAAASVLDTDLIEETRKLTGYVRSGTVEDYARSHFMIPTAAGHDVIFENTLPIDYAAETMPAAVVAADLAVSTDTRERSAGLRALEEMRQRWLAAR
ncbi:phage antirepressor KilAC domain-containing protein [Leucobacter allii]|uniref:phage antirepressor KilAC domain-containing protein n=1 Tax=Leucobacter allii TaxID=2932247 RepID=UPI001FD40864|nr:phage antirepressor KilAC domain-containing protein [Leucobacter allii]UOR02412.1 phage antirepressor KilAC domain-containing protein [Leucobacter allii]